METIQKQVALFYGTIYNTPFETLSLKVKEKFGNTDAVQYLPVPANVPPEVPRLVMSYGDFSLNFAKNRVDIFFLKESARLESILENISFVMEQQGIIINRVGFVQKRFVEKNVNQLINLLSSDIRPTSAKEFGIMINVGKEIGGYSCNSIETLTFTKVTKLVDGIQTNLEGVVVDKDINTLLERRGDFLFTKEILLTLFPLLEIEAGNFILINHVN